MTYTLTQVLDALDAVVADFGADHVQETCQYRNDVGEWDRDTGHYKVISQGTQPVCIVAQVLARIAPDLLPLVENDETWGAQDDTILSQFAPEANRVLDRAQEAQDGRHDNKHLPAPWGEAVAYAKEAVA